ncbi:hypothetical protein CIB48_g3651 [Xylaria polymorpha]|nr:hypothetical protein CIB48_g3651 [Xylaria polymorpha]
MAQAAVLDSAAASAEPTRTKGLNYHDRELAIGAGRLAGIGKTHTVPEPNTKESYHGSIHARALFRSLVASIAVAFPLASMRSRGAKAVAKAESLPYPRRAVNELGRE